MTQVYERKMDSIRMIDEQYKPSLKYILNICNAAPSSSGRTVFNHNNVPNHNQVTQFVVALTPLNSPPATNIIDSHCLDSLEFEKSVLSLARKWNWDFRGGKAIRHSACITAIEFVRQLKMKNPFVPLPIVSPSKRGAVALTWRSDTQSLTVFFKNPKDENLDYQLEGSNFTFETAQDKREKLEKRILAL